ncbi:hypothetical protein CDL15_Pgr012272 [Punica granatum]|uniref:Uncharacterized protein n=1 Tax=Punica granatum TaxID=22663 RepID=A0A218WTM1_PUNGR|nr:hypothetical protein CDL15_Pgr012272 [Punica granatum]
MTCDRARAIKPAGKEKKATLIEAKREKEEAVAEAGELKEKDPQVDKRGYNTFAYYYSNRAILGEPESPIEDALA